MAILSSDIKWFHSGGGANANIANDLGGAISSAELTDAADNNNFDDVTGDESSAGDDEYRGIYVKNAHGSLTLSNAYVWIQTQTPGADDVSIALAAEGASASMAAIANESTAPATVIFSAPANKAAGLSVGSLAAAAYYGIWEKRHVPVGCAAYTANSFVLKLEGDTPA